MKLLMSVPFCDATSIKQVIKHKPKSVKFLVYMISVLLLWGGFLSAANAANRYWLTIWTINTADTRPAGQLRYLPDPEIVEYDGLNKQLQEATAAQVAKPAPDALGALDPGWCNFNVNLFHPDYDPEPKYDRNCDDGIAYDLTYFRDVTICDETKPFVFWNPATYNLECTPTDPNPPQEPIIPPLEKNLGSDPPCSSPYVGNEITNNKRIYQNWIPR